MQTNEIVSRHAANKEAQKALHRKINAAELSRGLGEGSSAEVRILRADLRDLEREAQRLQAELNAQSSKYDPQLKGWTRIDIQTGQTVELSPRF